MKKRFILQHSQQKENWWVFTDTLNGVVIHFEEGRFNETQMVSMLNDIDSPDVMEIARIMGEMGEWLATYHREIAMGQKCIDFDEILNQAKKGYFFVDEWCNNHSLDDVVTLRDELELEAIAMGMGNGTIVFTDIKSDDEKFNEIKTRGIGGLSEKEQIEQKNILETLSWINKRLGDE